MCDSIVVHAPDGWWLAKNSDREPSEAQSVEHHPAAPAPASRHARRRCTHVEVDDREPRRAMIIARPAWMWGAEMGVNQSGLAIANEAVFTRMPVAPRGLTGMDLLRLALERADTASQGVAVITSLLRRYPQGGPMGHRARGFAYHSSFLLADGEQAWLLETAGWLWAARRLRGRHTASNVLTIGSDHDRIHPEAEAHARAQGLWREDGPLSFARAFGDPWLAAATGGHGRRACTERLAARSGDAFATLAATLRSHAGRLPAAGWRMHMPCAHASWLPTRRAGQTTGSMIARAGAAPRVWMTGTSSPCLSVFKPVAADHDALDGRGVAGPVPDAGLWWAHERLHRRVIVDHAAGAEVGAAERAALEARGRDEVDPGRFAALWHEHHASIPAWQAAARRSTRRGLGPYERFWRAQDRRDGLG
ncbi:MAG: C69 family dipeptidase [Myxococcales bacterium]|nr:C69 family dipeptidase [Myxococcales bacterium]